MAEAGLKRLLNQAARGGVIRRRSVGRDSEGGGLPQSRLRNGLSVRGGTASVGTWEVRAHARTIQGKRRPVKTGCHAAHLGCGTSLAICTPGPPSIQHHLFFPSSTGMTDKHHQLSQPKLFFVSKTESKSCHYYQNCYHDSTGMNPG